MTINATYIILSIGRVYNILAPNSKWANSMNERAIIRGYNNHKANNHCRELLFHKYANRIRVNEKLSRSIVSFQANKNKPYHNWFKFKEAFSTELVNYFLKLYKPVDIKLPELLDPFAGSGTTLIEGAKANWKATGIELLPVGIAAIKAKIKANYIRKDILGHYIKELRKLNFNDNNINDSFFNHINITKDAFPKENEIAIANYNKFLKNIDDQEANYIFWFAGMSILEDISYTRKDGQYLRWDARAGRSNNSKFNKGKILNFKFAIENKLLQIYNDLDNDRDQIRKSRISIKEGSCLNILPKLPTNKFNLVITSPPYCNRYDYTRTYALELGFMNLNEMKVKNLRQTLLSSTVENKSKLGYLQHIYREHPKKAQFDILFNNFKNHAAVQEVLDLLYKARYENKLNNNNIPSLVENYLFEMSVVINELFRVLAPLGRVIMVNDNVQYNGEEIPIDLILSDFAEMAGFNIDHIWILKKGKGNSSQQMGQYGRNEIRKCVYVWTKPLSIFD